MRFVIFVLAVLVPTTVSAQSAFDGGGEPQRPSQSTTAETVATDCNGSPKGRWRAWVADTGIMFTLEVTIIDGKFRVVPQTTNVTRARGEFITRSNFADIIGGRLFKNSPLANVLTNSNQCFLTGTIKIADHPNIFLAEVWVQKGNDYLKGWVDFGGGVWMFEAQKY